LFVTYSHRNRLFVNGKAQDAAHNVRPCEHLALANHLQRIKF